ncbi:MAG: hypothetical protein ABI193_18165 [Minicystis sp.]
MVTDRSASGSNAVSGTSSVTGSTGSTGGAGGQGGSGSAVTGSGGSIVGATTTSGGIDAGVPLADAGIAPADDGDACLARPQGCNIGEDPPGNLAANHLQEVLTMCGSMSGCPNGCFCGDLTVSFDNQGCATALGYNSGLLPDVETCLVGHLNTERWSCGAGMVAHLQVPCTTEK